MPPILSWTLPIFVIKPTLFTFLINSIGGVVFQLKVTRWEPGKHLVCRTVSWSSRSLGSDSRGGDISVFSFCCRNRWHPCPLPDEGHQSCGAGGEGRKTRNVEILLGVWLTERFLRHPGPWNQEWGLLPTGRNVDPSPFVRELAPTCSPLWVRAVSHRRRNPICLKIARSRWLS